MIAAATHDLGDHRARWCYREVAAWKAAQRKEATTAVQGLAVQVRTQGLLVTVAGRLADGGVHRDLADALARWLLVDAPHRTLAAKQGATGATAHDLLAACAEAGRVDHAAATREAVALCDQLKLFANALKPEEG